MNQFGLGNFLQRFLNYPHPNLKGGMPNNAQAGADIKFQAAEQALNQSHIIQNSVSQYTLQHTFNRAIINDLKMNNLANFERSTYIKDLMNLPKEIQEVLVMVQNNASAVTKEAAEVLSKNINIATLAELIQTGGKEAMNKLILVMAEASKQGLTDLSQIKDAMKLINASVSVASGENPNQILKSFMLLYLPWLPLQEGVDFDLEIESSEGEEGDSELSITIMISTKNYGNVRVTLILLAGNSMSIVINCCKEFPKEELLKRIKAESQSHSIQSDVTFEEQKNIKKEEDAPRQTKISMSNLMEVNPFLLLMANAVIRHTIEIDNQA